MDFRNTKSISVDGKSASKVYIDSKLVWEKEKHISVIHIDFDSITKLTDNVGYIYYGPKGATDDPSEMSLSYIKSKATQIGTFSGSYEDIDLTFDSSKAEKISNPEYEGRIPFTIDTPLHKDAPLAYKNYRGVYPDVEWTLTATYNELKDTKVIDCKPTWKPEEISLGMSPDHLDKSNEWGNFVVYMFVMPVGSVVGTNILSAFTTNNWTPFYSSVHPPYVEYKQEQSGYWDARSATIGVYTVNKTGTDTIYWNTDGLSAEYLFWCVVPKKASVDLNGEWAESTYEKPSDCPEGYDMYMSDSNYHVDGGIATMYINFDEGFSGEYTIYINSYAESGFDYTKAYDLDSDDNWIDDTKDYQFDPSSNMGAWKAVTYNIPDDGNTHQIKIEYVKDGGWDSDYDRGFVLIPTQN